MIHFADPSRSPGHIPFPPERTKPTCFFQIGNNQILFKSRGKAEKCRQQTIAAKVGAVGHRAGTSDEGMASVALQL